MNYIQQAKKLLETDIYNDTIGKIDPERILQWMESQDTLNYLHNYVEEYEILIDKISDTENRWLGPISKSNDNIHNLENDRVGYDGSWLDLEWSRPKIPIRDEHMELFKSGYRKRKLYPGYSEIGKTLWHMYEAQMCKSQSVNKAI